MDTRVRVVAVRLNEREVGVLRELRKQEGCTTQAEIFRLLLRWAGVSRGLIPPPIGQDMARTCN